jgi:hypothetical protein
VGITPTVSGKFQLFNGPLRRCRYSTSICLVHPVPPVDREVVVRRGDLITLSVNFLYKEPSTHISVKCAEIPLLAHGEELQSAENSLSLDMALWDITSGNGAYLSAFCDPCHGPSFISGAGICGCLVRFHGRYSPIQNWKAKICLEFPIMVDGSKEQKRYRYVDAPGFLVAQILK